MRKALWALPILVFLAACSDTGGLSAKSDDSPFAPDVDPDGDSVNGLIVGHRLMEAGQYELAMDAFKRAAVSDGLTPEILVALGSSNLALGRLNQAEKLLRRVIDEKPRWSEAWNNLGVVLMERGEDAEASEVFRRAYALDNGESDAIRDNLRLALEKLDNPGYGETIEQDYKLVRRGSSQYLIRRM
jgi:Flp pilus assembly protein TadD